MTPQTLVTAWTPVPHPSPTIADAWALGEYLVTRITGDACYGLYHLDNWEATAWGTLEELKTEGANLWAADIAKAFRAQQDPAHEEGDVQVSDQGSIVLILPVTKAAQDWIAENVQDDAQWLGRSLAVERRYAPYLVEGMVSAGLAFA